MWKLRPKRAASSVLVENTAEAVTESLGREEVSKVRKMDGSGWEDYCLSISSWGNSDSHHVQSKVSLKAF